MEVITCKIKLGKFKFFKVLNDFINDISKSRDRDFRSRRLEEKGEGGGHMMFLITERGGESFERA